MRAKAAAEATRWVVLPLCSCLEAGDPRLGGLGQTALGEIGHIQIETGSSKALGVVLK